jgi:hypothetical protein
MVDTTITHLQAAVISVELLRQGTIRPVHLCVETMTTTVEYVDLLQRVLMLVLATMLLTMDRRLTLRAMVHHPVENLMTVGPHLQTDTPLDHHADEMILTGLLHGKIFTFAICPH